MIDLTELETLIATYTKSLDNIPERTIEKCETSVEYANIELAAFLTWLKAQQGEVDEETQTPFELAWAVPQESVKVEWPNLVTPEEQAKILEEVDHIATAIAGREQKESTMEISIQFEGVDPFTLHSGDQFFLDVKTKTWRVRRRA